jgi:hypothetical protein
MIVAASIGAGIATTRVLWSVEPPTCVIGLGWNTPLCHIFIIGERMLTLTIVGMLLGLAMFIIGESNPGESLTQH